MKERIALTIVFLLSLAVVVSCSTWTTGKTTTTIDLASRNAICVAENFDLPWDQVIAKCALDPKNLTDLMRLYASSRATAMRAGAVGMSKP